jgi:hypothetical protein
MLLMKRIVLVFLLGALALVGPAPLHAGFVAAVDYSGGTAGFSTSGMIGYRFTVHQTVAIDAIGWHEDVASAAPYTVAIWDTHGSLIPGTSVTIPASAPITGHYQYVSLGNSVTLPTQDYVIAGTTSTGSDVFTALATAVTDPRITFDTARAEAGIGFFFPVSENSVINAGWFGPSFEIAPAAAAAPEPASLALMSMGTLGLLSSVCWRRWRTKV